MDNAPFYCMVEIPPGTRENVSTSIAADSAMRTETFKVKADDLFSAIPYIVGVSRVDGGPVLHRQVPARHPIYKGMRATKITSIQGRGGPERAINGVNGARGVVPETGTGCITGLYEWYYITVQFEQPNYPMLSDAQVPLHASGDCEYVRWSVRTFKPQLETIARKGQQWRFLNIPNANGAAGNVNPNGQVTMTGDTFIRIPKGILEMKWYDVPERWTHLGVNQIGGLIPTNIMRAVGTVNSRPFPQSAAAPNDQNQLGVAGITNLVQFKPGTLLMLEPEAPTVHSRFDPEIYQLGFVDPNLFPRCYDWTFRWLYFDPEFSQANSIFADPHLDVGAAPFRVRGHNLLPLREPRGGYAFYAAVQSERVVNPPCVLPGFTVSDRYLTYPYFNHELVFSYCRSLNDDGGLMPPP